MNGGRHREDVTTKRHTGSDRALAVDTVHVIRFADEQSQQQFENERACQQRLADEYLHELLSCCDATGTERQDPTWVDKITVLVLGLHRHLGAGRALPSAWASAQTHERERIISSTDGMSR
jgi:hypothetical protein